MQASRPVQGYVCTRTHTHARAGMWVCPQTGMCVDEQCTHVLRRKRIHTDTHAHSKVPTWGKNRYLYVCTAAAYGLIYTFSQMLTWQVWYSHVCSWSTHVLVKQCMCPHMPIYPHSPSTLHKMCLSVHPKTGGAPTRPS